MNAANGTVVTAKVFIGPADGRLVRGSSVEAIAKVQFGRGGRKIEVKEEKRGTYAVLADMGAGCVGIVGRIKIVY